MAPKPKKSEQQRILEVPAARALLMGAIRKATEAYCDLVEHLGDVEAAEVWDRIPKRSKPGRRPGPVSEARDVELLALFDHRVTQAKGRPAHGLASQLARSLHENSPGTYGATQKGIKQKLHRLLKERRLSRPTKIKRLADHGEEILSKLSKEISKHFDQMDSVLLANEIEKIREEVTESRRELKARLKALVANYNER